MTTASSLTIHTDGGSRGNPGPAATGIVVLSAGEVIHSFGRYLGIATNNVAEYSAVIDALNWIISSDHDPELCRRVLDFKLDSMLVVEQLNRRWKIKDARLLELATQIWGLLTSHHLRATFSYVPRAQNHLADAQVNQCLDAQTSSSRT